MNKYITLTLSLITLSLLSPFSFAQDDRMAGAPPAEIQREKEDDIYRQLNLFGDVFERVRVHYVEEVDDQELIESAINGMLSSLDPHSSYLSEKDFKDMLQQTKGEFGGLGMEVTMEDGLVKVVSPIDDTPAFAAGIQAGDLLTHLDGKPVIGLSLKEAVEIMRGEVGTEIELTVRREGESELLYITLVRDIIRIRPVKDNIFKDHVGYVRLTTFNDNTTDDTEDAIKRIKKELGENLAGFVIDLRNNPGGLLEQAIGVSDLFLDRGEIVSTRGRHKIDTKRDNARSGDILKGYPIVVLVNSGSASASEIVAGALQDHRRALIMGTKTFGKGSVQTVVPLHGHGAMRLTTSRYYTPSGRSIQATGIEPDIEVEISKVETLEYRKTHEADLKGALVNPNQKNTDDDTSEKSEEEIKEEENAELLHKDYQLDRAVDLIRGLSMYNGKVIMDEPSDKSQEE